MPAFLRFLWTVRPASEFWQAVVEDVQISIDFRVAAGGFLETVEKLRRHWA